MKRMRLWLRELTLTQQLLTIIFLFVILYTGFVFIFLSPSIDVFAETEMYRVLHTSQEDMINYIENNPNGKLKFSSDANVYVTDVIYDASSDEFVMINGKMSSEELMDSIRSNAVHDLTGTQDFKAIVSNIGNEENTSAVYYYSISRLGDGRFLVSIMSDAYRMQFRSSLVSGVVMMNVLFVSILFVLLMVWVTSFIIPLGQIKNYVTKVKNDEPDAELVIHRRDEIGQVADALKEMKEELERQNREKEEMIQNISHDLKTPIATIKSYSEAIKDGIYPYETLEKSCDVIIEHAERLEKKVQSLIILNKMGYLLDDCEEGETLPMADIISKVLLSLKVVRPEIRFIEDVDSSVCFHGEEEPWRIAVENLIDNALRYAKTYIRITLKPGELCVINDGSHIDPEIADSLFKPYQKGSDGKFGLGLSIVNRVVVTYGYHVRAENLQEGVCFRIWSDTSHTVKQKKQPDRKASRNKKRKGKQS